MLKYISQEQIVDELERVAEHLNYVEFGKKAFDREARISFKTVKSRFGTWSNALAVLKNRLQAKGRDLLPRPHAPNRIYSDQELFNEMERIWKELGHRPSRIDWERSNSRISYQTIKYRFGSWNKGWARFSDGRLRGLSLGSGR